MSGEDPFPLGWAITILRNFSKKKYYFEECQLPTFSLGYVWIQSILGVLKNDFIIF